MMPADPEARIYLILSVALAVFLVVHIVISLRALKTADRAERRARILRSQLAIANRALEHWKMTDRQRGYTTAAADPGGVENPGGAAKLTRPPAAAVQGLDLPAQHGTLPEHQRRIEDIRSAAADLIAETKETTP